jgi:hypothetical protein
MLAPSAVRVIFIRHNRDLDDRSMGLAARQSSIDDPFRDSKAPPSERNLKSLSRKTSGKIIPSQFELPSGRPAAGQARGSDPSRIQLALVNWNESLRVG